MTIPRLTLDDMIALCDEISSLTRAGIPLDRGLRTAAADLPHRLRSATDAIGQAIESGSPLESIVKRPELGLPLIFQAIITAGERAGRLPLALQRLAETARLAAQTRQTAYVALLYPLIIMVLVIVLAIVLLPELTKTFEEANTAQDLVADSWFNSFLVFDRHFSNWMWMIPAAILVLSGVWWWQTRGARAAQSEWFSLRMFWIPKMRSLLRAGRSANFCQMLGLLVGQRVPLHEAIPLAGEASGNRRLRRISSEVARQIADGHIQPSLLRDRAFPPLLSWLIQSKPRPELLAAALNQLGEHYWRRSQALAQLIQIQLPVFCMLALGGTVALAYTMAVVLPWGSLLMRIAKTVGGT
jgi:type II secretory pathway component PulF